MGVDELHRKEKEEFRRMALEVGETLSAWQEEVLDLFLSTEGHVTADALARRLEKGGEPVATEAVRQVLDMLCRFGIAQKTLLNGGGQVYEHLHLGGKHDHLICTSCGSVTEISNPRLDGITLEAAKAHGFTPVMHRLTIHGLCSRCGARGGGRGAFPLSMASAGERVVISSFTGKGGATRRLSDLGLHVGDTVEVINRSGPMILNVKGSRLALGMGLAQKVMVTPSG